MAQKQAKVPQTKTLPELISTGKVQNSQTKKDELKP
jgi:hypothetical protein